MIRASLDIWTSTPLCWTDENDPRAGGAVSSSYRQVSKGGAASARADLAAAPQQASPARLALFLALVGGGIFLATLPTRNEQKAPGTNTPRMITAKAAPSPTPAPPVVRSTPSSRKAVVAP